MSYDEPTHYQNHRQHADDLLEQGIDTLRYLKWEVCPQCHGKGTSCAYLGSYTQSEMDEAGPDFYEDYMSGFYDRECDVCHGRTTVEQFDFEAMPEDILKAVSDELEQDAEMYAEMAAERRAGC